MTYQQRIRETFNVQKINEQSEKQKKLQTRNENQSEKRQERANARRRKTLNHKTPNNKRLVPQR